MIAGTGEPKYVRVSNENIDQLGIRQLVRFVGHLGGQVKRDAFEAAELFVLPSFSEGSPITAWEALGAGVPLLITRCSPMDEACEVGACWWVDSDVDSLSEALEDALSKSPQELERMGLVGKDLICRKHRWSVIAEGYRAIAAWLLGTGNKPRCILP